MKEQEVRFKLGESELAGTLAWPDSGGLFPGVLFLPGSGPTDRNDNSKKLHINAFYDISRYLAQNGIASLRFAKRGVGQSHGDHQTTGFIDNAQDALAALEYLRLRNDMQRGNLYIMGHSEGAFLAVKLARGGAKVAGLVVWAG